MTLVGARAPAARRVSSAWASWQRIGLPRRPGPRPSGDGRPSRSPACCSSSSSRSTGSATARRWPRPSAADRQVGRAQDVEHLLDNEARAARPPGHRGRHGSGRQQERRRSWGSGPRSSSPTRAVTGRITAPFAWLFRPWVVVPVLVAFAVCWWVLASRAWQPRPDRRSTPPACCSPSSFSRSPPPVGTSSGTPPRAEPRGSARSDGRRPLPRVAGLLHRCRRLLPATPMGPARGRPRRPVLQRHRRRRRRRRLVGDTLDALLLVVAPQLLLMLRQLAPIVRADGYHILADLTGVPDLFRHLEPILAGLLPTNWGNLSHCAGGHGGSCRHGFSSSFRCWCGCSS